MGFRDLEAFNLVLLEKKIEDYKATKLIGIEGIESKVFSKPKLQKCQDWIKAIIYVKEYIGSKEPIITRNQMENKQR